MVYEMYKYYLEKEKEFLDTLDIQDLIIPDIEVSNLMDIIEDKYHDLYKEESYIFNCMNTDEFMTYLKNRFGTNFKEEIKYYIL